jgi:hypothetical protein
MPLQLLSELKTETGLICLTSRKSGRNWIF